MPAEPIPVPVAQAEAIARCFEKSMVVILSYDPAHHALFTTTYGVSPFDKENAAAAGEIATKALGFDLSKKQTFEDFHQDYNPANYKAAMELLQSLFTRRETTPAAMQRIEEFLKTTGWRLRHG